MDRKPVKIFAPSNDDGEMQPQENAIEQMNEVMKHPQAVAGALMADHHLGYDMPIGGVVAYDDAISPSGVGFDIACGNMAVRTNLRLRDLLGVEASDSPPNMIPYMSPEEFNAKIKPIMRQIQKRIEFGVGRTNAQPVDDPVMDASSTWDAIAEEFGEGLREKARAQLGTVGSGNHYVDLLVDDSGWVWVANHFGSRGLGHTIATYFMEKGSVIPASSNLGEFYIAAMHLAGKYAYAGREYVIGEVLDILGATAEFEVHNHHNFAWYENGLWVVRKGATPLTNEPAFIGGSMGDYSVIVRGKSNAELMSAANGLGGIADIGALGSAPHGAGRIMSRTAASGKLRKMWSCNNRNCNFVVPITDDNREHPFGPDTRPQCPDCYGETFRKIRGRDKSTAAIDWDSVRQSLTARGITVLGAGADEAPGVYKSLTSVIFAHENIEVMEVLRPIGVVMAGEDTFDPYRD